MLGEEARNLFERIIHSYLLLCLRWLLLETDCLTARSHVLASPEAVRIDQVAALAQRVALIETIRPDGVLFAEDRETRRLG